jgi:hypothetical protein
MRTSMRLLARLSKEIVSRWVTSFLKSVSLHVIRESGEAYRSILYYRSGDLMVFMYLFAKNDRENITPKEMNELVQIARLYDTMHGQAIEMAIKEEKLRRWHYEAD